MASKWSECTSLPTNIVRFSNAVKINDNEFIIASENHSIYKTSFESEYHGILKYNTINKTWTNLVKYPDDMTMEDHQIAYNPNNKKIYLQGLDMCVIIYDINNKKFKIFSSHIQCGSNPTLLIINDELHLFGGFSSNKHLLFNKTYCEYKTIDEINSSIQGLHKPYSVYVPSKNCAFIMGGTEINMPLGTNACDTIYLYNFNTKTHEKLDVCLPKEYSSLSAVLNADQDKIILFGGRVENAVVYDDIYIFDINTYKFTKSKIKCPCPGDFRPILMDNSSIEELIVFGYLHYIWNQIKVNKSYILPMQLIKLIEKFYAYKDIYLIKYLFDFSADNSKKRKAKMWRINANEI